MAATGASGGAVALWDLRFTSAPLTSASPPQAAGDVWEVRAQGGGGGRGGRGKEAERAVVSCSGWRLLLLLLLSVPPRTYHVIHSRSARCWKLISVVLWGSDNQVTPWLK
jgi:hypothetical protein